MSLKKFADAITMCLIFTILLAVPRGAHAIDVVYPPNAPRIASDFQDDDDLNGQRRGNEHQGIDLTGRVGQPILAAADGTVLEATVEDCWGPTISVDHGNDANGEKIIALYGHVGEMLVGEGEQIKRGDVIARLGDNQNSYECIKSARHLHFQLGREHRDRNSRNSFHWGHSYFLKDGNAGVNPHQYWADGPGKVTCFELNRSYVPGSLTYPFPCPSKS